MGSGPTDLETHYVGFDLFGQPGHRLAICNKPANKEGTHMNTFPLSPEAKVVLTSTHTNATEDDMVRVRFIEPDNNIQRPMIAFFAPFDFRPAHNQRDAAMCDALIHYEAVWENTDPLQTTLSYKDAHGCWCVECGNGVVTAEDGSGHVCPNPSCQNHNSDICPQWAKDVYKRSA